MSSEENVKRFRFLRAALKRGIDEDLTSLQRSQEELEKEYPSKVKLSFGLSFPQEEQDLRRQLLPSREEEPITIEILSDRTDRQQIEIEKKIVRPSPRRNQFFGKNSGIRRSKARNVMEKTAE